MKKRKLLILTSLLLVVVMLLSGCATHRMMTDGEQYRDTALTPTSAAAVEALLGASYENNCEELVYLSDIVIDGEDSHKKHIVYNLATNAVVLTVTETLTTRVDVELHEGYGENAFFTVKTTSWQMVESAPDNYTYKTALCAASGAVIAEAEDLLDIQCALDLIVFDSKCYRMDEDGAMEHAFDLGDFAALPELTGKANNRYFYANEEGVVILYDDTCKMLTHYQAPSDALFVMSNQLENGNVLVQYLMTETEESKDYSFIVSNNTGGIPKGKYTLVTKLIKKSGKVKDLKLDWLLVEVMNNEQGDLAEMMGYARGYDNLAIACEIVDGRIEYSVSKFKLVKVSNSGKVKGEIKQVIEGQMALNIDFIGENRWVMQDVAEREFLIDEKGKVIGEVTGSENVNAVYFIVAGKLYDYDLNMVYDYEAAKQHLYDGDDGVMRHGVLLEDEDGAVVCYANGAAASIIAKDAPREIVKVAQNYFVVKDSTDAQNVKYDVYNDVGTKLVTLDNEPYRVTSFEGACLLRYMNADSEYVYYRVA